MINESLYSSNKMDWGTWVYYDLLIGTASFQPINTGLFTIR